MKKRLFACLTAVCIGGALLLSSFACAEAKPVVRTSAQPCLHGMELWYAEQAGWLKDAPFSSEFLFFPSGGGQTEALAAAQWDCGAMGTVPTMMASMRYGYKLIGISNVESETNDLWVRPDSPLLKTKGANPQYPNIYGTADDWKGKKILGPTVTTAHYALSATLQALGLSDKDVNIVHMELGQAMTAFNAGEGDIIMLWAPQSYMAEARGWKKVSSGTAANAVIAGGIGVRKEFAEEHPDLVVEWLDVYMRGVEMMRDNPAGSVDPLLSYFNDYCGLELSRDMVEKEFKYRDLFNVSEQIAALEDPNKLPTWLRGVADFMLEQGRISQKEYDAYVNANFNIDSSFMKKLAEKRAAAAAK
ncbi:ABC transporter substrate-binding protein [Mailhella massiliensis]|uniref:ABC transporter substrate-binding protein n=1 Tax=Mailhella massiliensis TaxID=1903261 RepID=UPI002353773E|nr:ABC transporter substrate-binding protein [Mailhella massiliensis]